MLTLKTSGALAAAAFLTFGLAGVLLAWPERPFSNTPHLLKEEEVEEESSVLLESAAEPVITPAASTSGPTMTRPFGLTITQPARAKHTGTVILLHGLGDTANGWAPVGPQLNLPHLKFIYPTAPTRPITVNMGMRMPGWFDIQHLNQDSLQDMMKGKPMDPEGVQESIRHVTGLVDKEIAGGIPANRIVVGGFSQGGHIALKTVLTHSPPLAACLALSTWMEPSKLEIPPENLKIPIFQGHGTADPVIPVFIGSSTHDVLERLGCTAAEWHVYQGMGHSSTPQEFKEVREFLLRVLPEHKASRDELLKMSARELKAFIERSGGSTVGLLEKPELLERAMGLL